MFLNIRALLRTALAFSAGMINCKESFFQERGQPDHSRPAYGAVILKDARLSFSY